MANIVAKVERLEGGALRIDFRDDFSPEEIAALMVNIKEYCELRGWHPGRMLEAYNAIEMANRFPGAKRIGST